MRSIIPIGALYAFVAACSTTPNEPDVCFDGWSSTIDDKTVIVTPNQEYFDFLKLTYNVDRRAIKCVHLLAKEGKHIFVLKDWQTITVSGESPHFNDEKGYIISSHTKP